MRVEIGVHTNVCFDVDPEGFRGFSFEGIKTELLCLAEAEVGGDANEEDAEYWADQILATLPDEDVGDIY